MLKSFTLFITVKAITKLNLGHRNKLERKFQKISHRSSRSSDNAELVISRCCFAEDSKEMYKELQHTCIALNLVSFSNIAKCYHCGFLNLPDVLLRVRDKAG